MLRFVFATITLLIISALALTAPIGVHTTVDPFVVAMTVMGVRAEPVIPLYELTTYLGIRRSQIAEAIKRGVLHPFAPFPGARRKVVLEREVAALQATAIAQAAAKAAAEKPISIAPNRARKRLAREAADEKTQETVA
jgi:hypothetical protein